VLHQRYYTDGKVRATRSTPRMFSSVKRPERQANSLAAAILLPLKTIKEETKKYFNEHNLVWRLLKDFSINTNREEYMQYVGHIAATFNVSNDCARIRIENLSGVRYK